MSENTALKLYDQKLDEVGKISINFKFDPERKSTALVHQVVTATLAGRRAGTAATKTKAMVSGGGKKPFKQKGTGRARQGSTRSPLMPGGGTVHGPSPRSYEQKVNKKAYLRALDSVLIDKFHSNSLYVVSEFNYSGKTKEVYNILSSKKMGKALFVSTTEEDKVLLATSNLANAKALSIGALNIYDMVKYENLVINQECFKQLLERIQGIWKTQL
ncbi:MAG: 50S ribosomal protein L4 [Bacteriovoracaceae bacterium]|nr:50S ribosomal protein L4 [Bacteriovoracaceae bacterium]